MRFAHPYLESGSGSKLQTPTYILALATFFYFFVLSHVGLVVRGLSHPHGSALLRRRGSAAAAVTGVDVPVQANGIDEGARSATDESEHRVGVQGDSIETCACVFPKGQVAALVSHENQLPQVVLVLARHLDHGFSRVQEDLLQVSLGATHIVAPHLAIAHLEPGGSVRREEGRH